MNRTRRLAVAVSLVFLPVVPGRELHDKGRHGAPAISA
jgi:hypothetical protein